MQNISFVKFTELKNWDVKRIVDSTNLFNNKIRIASFHEFSSPPNIKKIQIKDSEEYKILGVRSYGLGAFVNRIVKGNTLKMRVYQKAKLNHLFWCKVDTKNGAFGIITKDLEDGIASSNMTFAELDINKIDTQYLQILFRSKKFNEYMDSFVTGTTNRKYIRPSQLYEEVEIPLPPLNDEDAKKRGLSTEVTQEKLVADYNRKIKEAEEAQQKAQQKEAEIETYLYSQLGIQKAEKKELKKGLNFVRFKDIDRWDALEQSIGIVGQLYNTKYPVNSIGKSFEIVKRSWNKKKSENEYFYYVELGAIDPNIGILSSKKVKVNKAPSRASQTIKKGDFILGTTRPYLKKFAIVTDEYNNNVCSSGFTVFKPNNKEYNLVYLKEVLMSDIGTEQFKNKMTGALYPAITNSQLREVKIPFPTTEIQSEIANTITIKRDQIKSLNNHSQILKQQAIKDFESIIFQTESK